MEKTVDEEHEVKPENLCSDMSSEGFSMAFKTEETEEHRQETNALHKIHVQDQSCVKIEYHTSVYKDRKLPIILNVKQEIEYDMNEKPGIQFSANAEAKTALIGCFCGESFQEDAYLQLHLKNVHSKSKVSDPSSVKKESTEHLIIVAAPMSELELGLESVEQKYYPAGGGNSIGSHSSKHFENGEHSSCGTDVETCSTTDYKSQPYEFSCETRANSGRGSSIKLHEALSIEVKSYECPVCSKSFTTKSNMYRHRKTHISGLTLGSVVSEQNNLMIPSKTVSKEKSFKCSICSKVFSRTTDLNTHIRAHTGEKPYKCSICDKTFSQLGTMNRHIKRHSGERPYQCKLCDNSYKMKDDLKTHIMRHNGEKSYACSFCPKTFVTTSHLKRHVMTHSCEKPFKCKLCDKKFTRLNTVKVHMRIHTGERPFKCTMCSKSFTTSSDRKSHYKRHTGEKPYKCIICEKAFTTKENMSIHVRSHTGDKPYRCDVCEKAFTKATSMKKHKEKLHGKKS